MHTPVLLGEVVDLLSPGPGQRFIDATIGPGGHAAAIAERILPGGTLLGVDRDEQALELARERLEPFQGHLELVQGSFADLADHVAHLGGGLADGVLMDLGVSSVQLDSGIRGFSFAVDGPLDMRLDTRGGRTASGLLQRSSARELERILREYGQERYARRIAGAIVARRGTLRRTLELAALVERVVPRRQHRLHPATRTFQALRIAVNDELGELERALATVPQWLAPGGRVAVVSFHSLEDRIVKHTFRDYARAGELEVLTAKPVRPSPAEVARNPRARSARLRAARRTEQ